MPDTAPPSRAALRLRPAQPADSSTLFELICCLADYEQLSHAVVGDAASLTEHLFGSPGYIEAVLAEYQGKPAGFALYFTSYSTLLMQPGLYLEDLFVLPEYRGQGIGKALLSHLGTCVVERQWGHLSWSVLDWNEPAIAFYRRMGVTIVDDVRICRVTGESLHHLAASEAFGVRPATLGDRTILFELVHANAAFDHNLDIFVDQPDALAAHLFGDRPYAEAIVAEHEGQIAGFATFFYNYSTFLTKPGLYVEDLFVMPEFRQKGIGSALLTYLAQQAVTRNCGRLEWLVRLWNDGAIAFYQSRGATILDDWRICQVQGSALATLTKGAA